MSCLLLIIFRLRLLTFVPIFLQMIEISERDLHCFSRFSVWSGREIWHNIIWSSTIHKFLWSNVWRMNHLSAPFFLGLFMILLQIAYKQISQALRHGNHTSECSIHISCVTSKLRFTRCTKIRDLAKSHLAATSRMFKGGSHDTQWMYKMAQTNYRWNLGEVFRRFTGQTKTPQQAGIPNTLALESRCFFSNILKVPPSF